MGLMAELCCVVDERQDLAPWARRALLSLESRASAAGMRTWMVERTVYGAALLGAVVAQHHDTLGAGTVTEALGHVAGLMVSILALLVGAELDSISTREAEKAASEGREPVRVECSPRAAQLRAMMPWLGLAGLSLAFGWMGALGFGWRLAYPAWRRWYRAHRPLGREVVR